MNREVIQEIKDRLDVISIVERYVPLQRVGSRFRGTCPFHQETKPSFYVDPNLGLYHCFGCNASGDIIDFYCKINGLEFYDGLVELAKEAGISLDLKKSKSFVPSKRKVLYEINSICLDYFRSTLKKSPNAIAYLKDRNIPQDLIDEFKIGYAPNLWESLKNYLIKKGYPLSSCVEAGVVVKNEKNRIYDRFRGRIIFPILDISGRCIGFGGRIIGDGEPKYLNTSENEVFKKGENLYGLYQARKEISLKKSVILTEGYIDVIRLHQHGYKNSCGVLGTALTNSHVKRLSRLCPKVILIFDGDKAGQKAALKSAQLFLAHGTRVEVVELPEDEDVDTYLQKYGNTGLDKLLERAKQGLAFCAKMIKLTHSPREVIDWCREFVNSLEDPALKGFYLPTLSREFGISEVELTRSTKKGESRQRILPQDKILSIGDREVLRFAICFPEYLEELSALDAGDYLKSKFSKALWEKLNNYSPEEILYNLDDKERSFYIESLFFKEREDDFEKFWSDLKGFLKKRQKEKKLSELKAELMRAQMEHNNEEINYYLSQINELLKYRG
ncbi:DNA primase [Desulfothermus sp.]